MPLVSVVIPTYNSGRYILETIESILGQEFGDLEIIIVDDNSNDNTSEIIKSITSEKIRYIRLNENHGGPSKPRNIGIRNAKGEFIAFCDSDDLFMPGRLKSAVDLLYHETTLGMTFTDAQKFGGFHEEKKKFLSSYTVFHSIPKTKVKEKSYILPSEKAFSGLFYENYILTCGVTVPKSIFRKVGYFDETLTNGDDRDMWMRIARKYDIGFIDMIGFKYRIRENSISRRGPTLHMNKIKVMRKHLSTLTSSRLRKQALVQIASNYYSIGYHYQSSLDIRSARRYYIESLKTYPTIIAFRGLFITILGKTLVRVLKKKLLNRKSLSSQE